MEKKNIYTVDYFIDKFSKIPEQLWMTEYFSDGTRCCAQGHCMSKELTRRIRDGYRSTVSDEAPKQPEWQSLLLIFSEDGSLPKGRTAVAQINNGRNNKYPQPTPKQRILAALHDIKKLQEKSTPSEPKEEPEYRFVEKHESIKPLLEKEIIYS